MEKKKKPFYKKWWFWLIVVVVIGVAGSGEEEEKNDVPTEYKSALKSAKKYSDMMHMSKQGLYDQLTSEYGEKFTAEEAQYAIDNLE